MDALDHIAAAQERRHCFQNFFAPIQHANPGWAAHLMRREGQKICPQFLYIDRQVRNGLGSVNQSQRANLVGLVDDLVRRVDRPQHVRHMRERYQARPQSQ